MMIVAVCTETPDQVDNYLGGCQTGHRDPEDPDGQNCTTLTLTKIRNVQPPAFTFPSFHFNYEFCNEKLEATFDEESEEIGEWVYASELRYPEDWKLEDQNLTISRVEHLCFLKKTFLCNNFKNLENSKGTYSL